jgi:hypothetical protein
MRKFSYEEQTIQLTAAIDIAINAFELFPPPNWDENNIQRAINTYMSLKNSLIDPEPRYKNTKSLSYLENDVFTYFQEGSGKTVDFFWAQIKSSGLHYRRENKLARVIKRGKIRNQLEYEFIIDVLVPYQQEGIIGPDETSLLNKFIAAYEEKHRDK